MDYRRLLLDHLPLVDQIVRTTGRRHHLSPAELDDFASFARLRLIEHDYAILRKFRHRSSLWTYLSAVIERLSLDYRVEQWGRWRPSAMAERLGVAAVLLERLVSRDGHTLDEAIAIIRTRHTPGMAEADLLKIWHQLPVRETTSDGRLAAASPPPVEPDVDEVELRENMERLDRVLRTALAQCSAHERLLLALRFDQDLSLNQIATLTGMSVTTLHRRLDKALRQLRVSFSRSGLEWNEVGSLIGLQSMVPTPFLRADAEKFLRRVRLFKRDG